MGYTLSEQMISVVWPTWSHTVGGRPDGGGERPTEGALRLQRGLSRYRPGFRLHLRRLHSHTGTTF